MKNPTKIKARRMYEVAKPEELDRLCLRHTIDEAWADVTDGDNSPETVTQYKKDGYRVIPFAVLDVSDPDALIQQVAIELYIAKSENVAWWWGSLHDKQKEPFRKQARAVLESLGIIPKRKPPRVTNH